MDLDTELARFNSAPAPQAWVREALERRDSELANQKILALTFELAHHKRIRFGRKNEQLSGEQRELFEETWNVDQAAMLAEAFRQRSARVSAPVARRFPITCRASNIVMSPKPAPAGNAGRRW